MKLLFDQNISYKIANKLSLVFPDCKHVSHVGLLNCDDTIIWKYAQKEDYTIVTFDTDFYDISLINGCPAKIIWLRSGNLTTTEIATLLTTNHLSLQTL